MSEGSYNQFCPVAMAAEILCSRWTLVLLRELVVGSTRFNELRRGVPRMSPALLSNGSRTSRRRASCRDRQCQGSRTCSSTA